MKRIFLIIFLCYFSNSYSQVISINTVIVSCQTGELFIDGVSFGAINADDASKQNLNIGEHYIQVKSATGNESQTIDIDENFKSIIKIGCIKKTVNNGVSLINKTLALEGLLSSETENNMFGLQQGDKLIINTAILNKKGNATLLITDVTRGNEIYRKESFNALTNEVVNIPSKSIYNITLYTDALFGKQASLSVNRIVAAGSSTNINTAIKRVYDTTNIEVLNTTARIFSSTNLNHYNTTPLTINLPANTKYWSYWIGVGQEGKVNMKNFVQDLSSALKLFSANPLVLFGMKLIPYLPAFNSTAVIDYKFMTTENSNLCVANKAYSYYRFKHADNISADYALINSTISDLVLTMTNNSAMTGQDVDVRVVAFVVKERLVMEE